MKSYYKLILQKCLSLNGQWQARSRSDTRSFRHARTRSRFACFDLKKIGSCGQSSKLFQHIQRHSFGSNTPNVVGKFLQNFGIACTNETWLLLRVQNYPSPRVNLSSTTLFIMIITSRSWFCCFLLQKINSQRNREDLCLPFGTLIRIGDVIVVYNTHLNVFHSFLIQMT